MSEGVDLRELPRELGERIEASLAHDERLLWLGQPRSRRISLRALPILLFAIPWTAFALFWEVAALAGTGILGGASSAVGGTTGAVGWGFAIIFPLFGLPFVLIGFAMLSAPWWMARRARRTVYGISTQRAFILDGGWGRELRSYPVAEIRNATSTERPDGWGAVTLMPPQITTDSSGRYRASNTAQFDDVRDPRRVLQLAHSLAGSPN